MPIIRPRRLSSRGAAFIGRFEGFRPLPYNDPAGHATIGYGHLIHLGRVTEDDRRKWKRMSQAQGLALLRKDSQRFADAVRRLVKPKLKQHEFDALVSFAFNVGVHAFEKSTLLKLLNRGDRRGAAAQLIRWDKAGGKRLPGLTRRRRAERLLFLTGRYR